VTAASDFIIDNIKVKSYTRRLDEARQLASANTEIEFDYNLKTSQSKASGAVTFLTTDRTLLFLQVFKLQQYDYVSKFGAGANPALTDYSAGSQTTPTTDASSSSSTTTSSASGLGISAVALLIAGVMSM
jgi:hypothetical protein